MIAMRWNKLVALISLIFLGLPVSASANTILVWGDSLCAAYGMRVEQGWVALLESRLRSGANTASNIVNGCISGETSSGGLNRLPEALEVHQPDILILGLGSNDGLRGQPLGQLKNNLRQMIELARAEGARVLLLGNRIPPNYGAPYTDGFARLYTELSSSEEVPLVPFLLDRVATDFSLLMVDGLHPRPEAQAMLLDTVWPYLDPLIVQGGVGSG